MLSYILIFVSLLNDDCVLIRINMKLIER